MAYEQFRPNSAYITFECKDVTFWYPSDPEQKKVFSGLNITISHGKTVGICGQTGCGGIVDVVKRCATEG